MPIETDAKLREILELDSIAVVGHSRSPGKPSHDVPDYLSRQGYDVIPVNPFVDEIGGREAYDSIDDVEEQVDIVEVFRPREEVPSIVDSVLDRDDVQIVWLQLGIRHDEAGATVENAGLGFVQDRCMKVEHKRVR